MKNIIYVITAVLSLAVLPVFAQQQGEGSNAMAAHHVKQGAQPQHKTVDANAKAAFFDKRKKAANATQKPAEKQQSEPQNALKGAEPGGH